MASISLSGMGSTPEIERLLANEITASGLSCELVDSVRYALGSQSVCVMVFEKYYMRASNRASLTVVVSADGDRVLVDAIGSGGGTGALLNFSWGAEDSFVGTVERILRPLGFC